jgi:uncharacterized repeat protein (TIGR04042 family)
MPEMTVAVRWPDGHVEEHYSPSLVMHDHLAPGAVYPVAEFTARAVTALGEAGERVRARYGFACTSAIASADRIRSLAAACAPDDTVEVLAMMPPLPPVPPTPAPPTPAPPAGPGAS